MRLFLAIVLAVTAITVTPANPTIDPGTTLQFHALDQDGNNIDSQVDWSSSDPTIAAIDGSGLADGLADGVTTITASLKVPGQPTDLTISGEK